MALPVNRPTLKEVTLAEGTTAFGSTPVAMNFVAPISGYIERVTAGCGASPGATTTVAVTVNGGADICGGALQVTTAAPFNNTVELPQTGANAVFVNQGDYIVATPSGGSAAVTGAVSVVIRPAG